MSTADRQQYLQKIQQVLPPTPSFDAWIASTRALPPDFEALPKVNGIPDPLTFLNGMKVQTPEQWAARRAEIQQNFEKYVWGTAPPRPHVDKVVLLNEEHGPGYVLRNVRLEFGPQGKGSVRARVVIPDGKGPYPVLINADLMGWAPALLRRGYISAGYAGNDSMDDADALAALYPNFDWALLPRRAWAASLVVDYLETLPQVDQKHIAIFGYSRNGKMTSIAAAMDTRIAALIAGSTGVGGVLPFRTSGETGIGEGIEATTRRFPTWFSPELRFFTGREDRLPVDGNLLAAMVAPRSLLMEWGTNDQVSNTWGNEATYYSALKVYKLLGVPDRVSTLRVPGFHGANDEAACLDWLDIQFGRSQETWTNNLIFQWDWGKWRNDTHQTLALSAFRQHPVHESALTGSDGKAIGSVEGWESHAADLRKSVVSMMGDAPPKLSDADLKEQRRRPMPPPGAPNPGQVVPDLPAWTIALGGIEYGWLSPAKDHVTSRHVTFGGSLAGDLYTPTNVPAGTRLPTVIWLHGYSYPLGYMWGYHEDLHPILALTQAGYAVLAYDQSGFGSRLTETGPFYERYPGWSHMGRLVEDARSAIDMLSQDSAVDPQKIYLFGYSLGGMVGLYTAALDTRVKGVVSVAGFTPMRTDTASTGTGGIARYSHERDLLPKLGFFVGHETQVPYDFNDLLGMIAPRPVIVLEPQLDRDATPADVHAAVMDAKKVYALYGAESHLALEEPWDYNRLTNTMQDNVIHWMAQNMR